MKGKVIFITGVSSSGKSTLASFIHNNISQPETQKKYKLTPFFLLPWDAFYEATLYDIHYKDRNDNNTMQKSLFNSSIDVIISFCKNGINVIFEGAIPNPSAKFLINQLKKNKSM